MSSDAEFSDKTAGQEAWPAIETRLLENGRGAVPPFPVELLPGAWRDWVEDRARGAAAPADYVAQALLAAVAAVCGAHAEARITPDWSEPLVLWQVLVGTSSSGKSPALDRLRDIMGTIEARIRTSKGERADGATRLVTGNPSIRAIAGIVTGNPRGVLLWRDHPSPWLAELGGDADDRGLWRDAWSARAVTLEEGDGPSLRLDRLAVSVLGTVEPDQLAGLEAADQGLMARFLYAWPDPPPFCPFGERRRSKADDSVRMLVAIEEQVRLSAGALALAFDPQALDRFETFLATLHRELKETEGLPAAWLGKGPGTVARLAALLELLEWSTGPATRPPGPVQRARVEAAIALWQGYFRPHADAVFRGAGSTDLERQARRVARWLKASRRTDASREDVRREALSRTVNAARADLVLDRLQVAGIVRPAVRNIPPQGGRPACRWQVNPALLAS